MYVNMFIVLHSAIHIYIGNNDDDDDYDDDDGLQALSAEHRVQSAAKRPSKSSPLHTASQKKVPAQLFSVTLC